MKKSNIKRKITLTQPLMYEYTSSSNGNLLTLFHSVTLQSTPGYGKYPKNLNLNTQKDA